MHEGNHNITLVTVFSLRTRGTCLWQGRSVVCQFCESECKEHMVNKQIIRNTLLSILLDNNTTIGPVRPGYEPRNFNTYT